MKKKKIIEKRRMLCMFLERERDLSEEVCWDQEDL